MSTQHARPKFELQDARRSAVSPSKYFFGGVVDDDSYLHPSRTGLNGLTTTHHTSFTTLPSIQPHPNISQKPPPETTPATGGAPRGLLSQIETCNKENLSTLGVLPRLYLPDADLKLKHFGILQTHVFHKIPWKRYGFKTGTRKVETVDAKSNRTPVVVGTVEPTNGQATPEAISRNLRSMCYDDNVQADFEGVGKWAAKDKSSRAEYVGLIAGHPDVRIPDPLGVHLGIVQVGAHLTLYKTNPLRVLVQLRSSCASYPDLLDQTGAGGLQHGESVYDCAVREGKEEINPDIPALLQAGRPEYDGQIVFATTRPKVARKYVGTFEISAKASFSRQVEAKWERKEPSNGGREDTAVKSFRWMSEQEIIAAMKDGKFKPNCALVMMRFLMTKGALLQKEDVYDEVCRGLVAEIPLPLPADLENYGEKKKPTS